MDLFSLRGTLHPTPPFDFDKSLDFLNRFLPSKNEQFCTAKTLTKTISVNSQAIVVKVESVGAIETPELNYILVSEYPISENTKFASLDRLAFFLSFYDNIQPFYRIGSSDPAFGPVIKQLYGYHQVKFPTPFENTSWAILSRETDLMNAKRKKQSLIETFGSEIEANGVRLRAFPEAHQIYAADIQQLVRILGDPRQAEHLHAIARGFVNVDEEFLRRAPYEQILSWLSGLKGMDEWTATYILIRGLGRMERALINDNRLLQAAAKVYGKQGADNLFEIVSQYGQWQGYWAHYLHLAA